VHDAGQVMSERGGGRRRGFLGALSGALTAVLAGMVTLPGLRFLTARRPRAAHDDDAIRVAVPDELKEERPLRVNVYGQRRDAWTRLDHARLGSAWLVRTPEGRVRAFSTVCPHLGCGVDWNEKTENFQCPCHGSAFGLDGRCLGGPAPRALDELDVQATGGQIRIHYRRFKTGTRTKEPIG
jgi:quinol---cytochrome c reductase iron-sulfur subunit, bacillus type